MKQKDYIHVVYIITKLELGGAQKVCLELFKGLQNANISSHLISGAQGTLVDTVKHNEQVILLDTFKREFSFSAIVHELQCLWDLIIQLRSLKKAHPTIFVHTHSTKAGIIGRWAAWCAGIKTRIHTIHGYGFHNHQSWLLWIPLYVLELITSIITTHYICVSSADVTTGTQLFPFFARKHSLIRAAVDQQQFYIPARRTSMDVDIVDESPMRTSSKTTFTFGTISCFKPQKNLFDLLNAFALVHQHNPHTRLEIIGDGTQRPAIEQWIKDHNLTQVIILHGWQAHVAPIMLTWNAFTLSSLWEGLPCAIIEARLLKLPVISYDTGGIKDIILHEKNGLLYTQKDWRALGHGMLAITHDKTLYTKLQKHADDLSAFKTTHMLNMHIELYTQLTNTK
jgi:glycosyltransferase involved in cell wall biosynthesis